MTAVKLYRGEYENGAEVIIEEMDFYPISIVQTPFVEVSEFRDLTGKKIRNILYKFTYIELELGTDELYQDKLNFLQNFWLAPLTKIKLNNEVRLCKIIDKGALNVERRGLLRNLKLKLEVY